MLILDAIAEERIARAMEAGEFDGLPGAGKPLELDDDSLVPEELRAAYRILKNAGFVPPEVEAMKEAGDLEAMIRTLGEGDARSRACARLNLLLATLGHSRPGQRVEAMYRDKLLKALNRD